MDLACALGVFDAEALPDPGPAYTGDVLDALLRTGFLPASTASLDLSSPVYAAYLSARRNASDKLDAALFDLAAKPFSARVNALCGERTESIRRFNDEARSAMEGLLDGERERRERTARAAAGFCEEYFARACPHLPFLQGRCTPFDVVQHLLLATPGHAAGPALAAELDAALRKTQAADGLSADDLMARARAPRGEAYAELASAEWAEGDAWSFAMDAFEPGGEALRVEGLTLSEARFLWAYCRSDEGALPPEVDVLAEAAADRMRRREREEAADAASSAARASALANIASFCAPRAAALRRLEEMAASGVIPASEHRRLAREEYEDMADELARPTWKTSACLADVVRRFSPPLPDTDARPAGAEA